MPDVSSTPSVRDDAEIVRWVRTHYPSLTTHVQVALVRGGFFADHLRRSFSREMAEQK